MEKQKGGKDYEALDKMKDIVMPRENEVMYVVIVDLGFTEERYDYITTKANAKFTEPRVLRKWLQKACRIYKVYSDSSCDVIKDAA